MNSQIQNIEHLKAAAGAVILHPASPRDPAAAAKRHRKRKEGPRGIGPVPSPDDIEAIRVIGEVCERSFRDLWEVGDRVLALICRPERPLKLAQIKSIVEARHESTLSRCKTAAAAIPKEKRLPGMSVYEAYEMVSAHREIPDLGLDLSAMLEMWRDRPALPDSSRKPGQRNVRQFFLEYVKGRRATEQEAKVDLIHKLPAVAGEAKCLLGHWESVQQPDWNGRVKMVFADPPYGQYERAADGGYSTGSTSPMRTAATNNDAEGALQTTLAAIRYCADVLTEDGVGVLCQAGTIIDRSAVGQVIDECGFICTDALIWAKDMVSPRVVQAPYGSGSEKLLIFHRRGVTLKDYSGGGLPRADLLYCRSPSQAFYSEFRAGRADTGEAHIYQKPFALMEYLLLKHTEPGDLILELFGCTGAMSIAAIKRSRDFRYFESDQENYNEGVHRIHLAQEGRFDELYDIPQKRPKYSFPQSIVDVVEAIRKYDERAAAPAVEPTESAIDPMSLDVGVGEVG